MTPAGEPLRALAGVGRTPISGAAVACANCHGADAKGGREASVAPPSITWDELAKPYGHVHGSRRHGPFDERSFRRAVNEGLDPAGHALDWAMPRYALSTTEAAALVAYLKRVALERDPGIGERSLRIGGMFPALMARAVGAYFERINRAGGIHQRRLELAVDELPVFAALTVLETGAQFDGAPIIRAYAAESEGGRLVFNVQAGPLEEAAALVDYALRRAGEGALRAAVVSAHGSGAAQRALERCKSRGCGDVLQTDWRHGDALKAQRREHVFFFGPAREFASFLDELQRSSDASWRPSVYAPGALARAAFAAQTRFAGRLFLAFPSAPPGRAWEPLRRELGLAAEHEAAQLAALAAASVLAEGLRRAGRDLSRERLVRALETLSDFDPEGFAPRVSYGPGRRVGARGSYVLALGAQGEAALAWVALD